MKNDQTPGVAGGCTHPVPENDLGIFAMHCHGNIPLPAHDLKKIIEGPVTAVQPELAQALAVVHVANEEEDMRYAG